MTGLQEAIMYSVLLAIVIILCCWIMGIAEKFIDAHYNRWYIPYCIVVKNSLFKLEGGINGSKYIKR